MPFIILASYVQTIYLQKLKGFNYSAILKGKQKGNNKIPF